LAAATKQGLFRDFLWASDRDKRFSAVEATDLVVSPCFNAVPNEESNRMTSKQGEHRLAGSELRQALRSPQERREAARQALERMRELAQGRLNVGERRRLLAQCASVRDAVDAAAVGK
jgi:hypothetical protein